MKAFARNRYLEWYLPRMRGADAINLHASGVRPLRPSDLRLGDYDPWTAGAELEQRLAAWLGADPEGVLFTPGATGGTLLALLALAASGDEVLVEAPIYEPMLRQSERVARVKRFRRRPERGWGLPLDEIDDRLSERTRLVMLTEPHNPSGTFAAREDVLALADRAAARDALLLVNEVYLGFSTAPSLLGARDNILVVSSFSKLLGSYWLRLGWLAGPPELIAPLRMAHMNLSMGTSPAAAYGLDLLGHADEWRERARATAQAGVGVVDEWVRRTEGVDWVRPTGGGFGCLQLPERIADDLGFAETLQQEHGVLVVPGRLFEVPGSLRLSWLQAGDDLERGLERIGRAFASRPLG